MLNSGRQNAQSDRTLENHAFAVTFFPAVSGTQMREDRLTLGQLKDEICRTKQARKEDLPLLKLATFGTEKTSKGSLRHDKNLHSITGIEGDYDRGEMSFEQACEKLRQSGLRGMIYTTPSHTSDKPRWRVILPLAKEAAPSQRTQLAARMNGVFLGLLADESFTRSQAYYFGNIGGRVPLNAETIDGDFLDERPDLDRGALGKHREAKNFDARRAAQNIASGRDLHMSTVALLGLYAQRGMPIQEAVAQLKSKYEHFPAGLRDDRWRERYDDIQRCAEDIFAKDCAQKADAARSENGRRPGSKSDILIELTQEAELLHAPDGAGYADVIVNGHRETLPIRSRSFHRWLTRRLYESTGGAANSDALKSALNVIEAKAHFAAAEMEVHVRVASQGGKIYLDLCDEEWRAVEVDATGWRVIARPPVRFRRAAGMRPLPIPVAGGSISMLRPFLNVRSDEDFVLVVAWMLGALRGRGPYPALVLSGEQGSAKSSFSALLRAMLDPNTAPLRTLPREDRDLFIAATNSHLLVFDNISGLPSWMSDSLCRLSTGGAFAVRQLHSDREEELFDAARPMILNGIEDIVTRPDLADRAIILTLEAIAEDKRRTEASLWADFKAQRPQILGALLSALVEGLRRLPDTTLPGFPRMADFALWVAACETAFQDSGTFWSAFNGNRDDVVEGIIEADSVAALVRTLIAERSEWTGTASELLAVLSHYGDERITKARNWPQTPRALSGRLRRAATFLRKVGIDIDFQRSGHGRQRKIQITSTSLHLAD